MALGCAGEYTLHVMYRGGRQRAFALNGGIASVEWRRKLDDTSDCVIVIAKAAVDSDCWGQLATLRVNFHEIRLFRDGDAVWEGPLVTWEENLEENTVTLTAHDVSEWLNGLFNRVDGAVTGVQDLSQLAKARIEKSVQLIPDLNILGYADYRVCRAPVDISDISANSETIGDFLRAMGGQGLDWTAMGRRLIFFPQATMGWEPQGRLFADDLLTGLRIVEDGLAAATRWVVRGGGNETGGRQRQGIAGGVSKFFGLREKAVDLWEMKRDQAALDHAAKLRLGYTHPPPLMVAIPDGSRLSPQAPVEVERLMPGVRIDIVVSQAIRPVHTAMRLTEVHVMWQAGVDGPPESVEISCQPIGAEFIEPAAEAVVRADTFAGDHPLTLVEDVGVRGA